MPKLLPPSRLSRPEPAVSDLLPAEMLIILAGDLRGPQHELNLRPLEADLVEQGAADAEFLKIGMHRQIADIAVEAAVGPAAQDSGQSLAFPGGNDQVRGPIEALDSAGIVQRTSQLGS